MSRFVREPGGRLVADPDGLAHGRGAYLCSAADCRKRAEDGAPFARSFRAPVLVDTDDLD